jgi:hypothetical protein
VDTDDIKEEMDAESLLDSDDEAGKVYPEPMKDSGIDESFFSELDTVRDFRVEPMVLGQQVPNHASHSDSHANGIDVAADPVISPLSSDNISVTMSDSLGSREHSAPVDHINDPLNSVFLISFSTFSRASRNIIFTVTRVDGLAKEAILFQAIEKGALYLFFGFEMTI